MVSPAVSPITLASAFAPGPVCLSFAVIGLFRGLSRVPARCHSYSPADGLRAEALPVRYAYPAPLSVQSRILIFFSVFAFFLFPSLIGRLRSPMYRALYFLSSCRISVFSAFVSFMCETEKNKKALQQILKFLIFPPYPLHVITSLYCLYFRFSFL